MQVDPYRTYWSAAELQMLCRARNDGSRDPEEDVQNFCHAGGRWCKQDSQTQRTQEMKGSNVSQLFWIALDYSIRPRISLQLRVSVHAMLLVCVMFLFWMSCLCVVGKAFPEGAMVSSTQLPDSGPKLILSPRYNSNIHILHENIPFFFTRHVFKIAFNFYLKWIILHWLIVKSFSRPLFFNKSKNRLFGIYYWPNLWSWKHIDIYFVIISLGD